jgi:FkbM family methyltransferase
MGGKFYFIENEPGESTRNLLVEIFKDSEHQENCLISSHTSEKLEGTGYKDYICPVISLSSFIELNSIVKIDLLKIDIEGDELDTLIGLEDKISLVRQLVIGNANKLNKFLNFQY